MKKILMSCMAASLLMSGSAMAMSPGEGKGERRHTFDAEKHAQVYKDMAKKIEDQCGKRLNWDEDLKAIKAQKQCARELLKELREDRADQHEERKGKIQAHHERSKIDKEARHEDRKAKRDRD